MGEMRRRLGGVGGTGDQIAAAGFLDSNPVTLDNCTLIYIEDHLDGGSDVTHIYRAAMGAGA